MLDGFQTKIGVLNLLLSAAASVTFLQSFILTESVLNVDSFIKKIQM